MKYRTAQSVLRRIARALRDERGSELVEFSLSILLLFAMLFGILDLSRAMYSYEFMSYAAQEGARFAIVRGNDWSSSCSTAAPPGFVMKYSCIASGTDVTNYIKSLALPGISQSNVSVSTTWPGTTPDCTKNCSACATTNSQGCLVKVTVSYTFSFFAPFLPKSALSFSGTSQKVIQE